MTDLLLLPREELDAAVGRLVSRRIRAVRASLGVSQRAVAAVAGICDMAISQTETMRSSPSIWILARIAAALGVELASLIPSSSEVLAECAANERARRG